MLQLFLLTGTLALASAAAVADLRPGTLHQLVFRDVDGNDLPTDGGLLTIVTVVTRHNEERARAVGNSVPEKYKGDPRYRYITVVNFQRKIPSPFRGVTRAIIRNRLDAESRELQEVYDDHKKNREARRDMHVIADFDGSTVTKLGLPVEMDEVAVFVFGPTGKLLARWTGVPPADALPKLLETTPVP